MIKGSVLEYMHEGWSDDVLFFKTFPGSGKTYTTIQSLVEGNWYFVYTSPNHTLGEREVSQPYNLLQMKSRRHFCSNPDMEEIERLGIDTRLLCDVCIDKDICDYYLRIREIFSYPQSWVGVHHHLGNLVQGYVETHGDCLDAVVIDEEFLQSLYVKFFIGLPSVTWTVRFLEQLPDGPEKEFVMFLIKELVFAISTGRVRDIDYEQIKVDIIEYGDRWRFNGMHLFLASVDLELIEMYQRGDLVKRNIVRPLMEMAEDFYRNRERPGYLESMINLVHNKAQDRYSVLFQRYDLGSVRFDDHKVIVLDATTPVEIYQKVFERPIRAMAYGSVDSATVYQFSGHPTVNRYPMSSLVKRPIVRGKRVIEFRDAFWKLLDIVKGVCEKHDKEHILIVSRRKHGIKEKIWEELVKEGVTAQMVDLKERWDGESRVCLGHFGGLRGLNDFRDFEVAVVFGAPFPHPGFVKRQSVLLDIEEQRLTELSREMEIIQDLYRIRPHSSMNAHFYVLTSVDLGMEAKTMNPKAMRRWIQGEELITSVDIRKEKIREDILRLIKRNGSMKKCSIRKAVKGSNELKEEVMNMLEEMGMLDRIEIKKKGRGRPAIGLRMSRAWRDV